MGWLAAGRWLGPPGGWLSSWSDLVFLTRLRLPVCDSVFLWLVLLPQGTWSSWGASDGVTTSGQLLRDICHELVLRVHSIEDTVYSVLQILSVFFKKRL